MTTLSYGGYGSGTNLLNLLNEAGIYSQFGGNYAHLGSDSTAQTTRMAEIVNRAIEEFLDANPILGLTTASLAMVAGTQSYSIPATTRALDIRRIYYADSGADASYDLKDLTYLSADQVRNLPLSWINGEQTWTQPLSWGFNATASQIVLYPMPAGTYTLTVEYRAAPTAITVANIGTPTSVTIGEVPSRWQYVLALRVAADIAAPKDLSLAASLMERYAMGMRVVQESLTDHYPTNRAGIRMMDEAALFTGSTWD